MDAQGNKLHSCNPNPADLTKVMVLRAAGPTRRQQKQVSGPLSLEAGSIKSPPS